MRRILIGSFVVLSACCIHASAQSLPTVGSDLIIKSKYLFRGAEFNDTPVFQPDVWINWSGLTLSGWTSVNMDRSGIYPGDKAGDVTDLGYSAEYAKTLDKLTLKAGYASYHYEGYNGFPSTAEVYEGAAYDFGVLQSQVSAYEDVDYIGTKSVYLNARLSRTFAIDKLSLTTAAWCGYGTDDHNAYYFGFAGDGLTDVGATIGLSYPLPGRLAKYMTVSVDCSVYQLVDQDLRDYVKDNGGDDFNVVCGLYVNFIFNPAETK